MIVTEDFLEQGKSEKGGYTAKQLNLFSIPWPPMKGWKNRIIGMEISDEMADQFLLLKKAHKKSPSDNSQTSLNL